MKSVFSEKQKFTQWWLWLILIAVGLIPLYGLYKQIYLGVPFGDKPMSNSGLVLYSLGTFAVISIFIFSALTTQINSKTIHFGFMPFISKSLHWNEVASASIVKYGFVGYGIRISSSYGMVYNVKGNKGLSIQLKNGKRYLIGTQKETELQYFLDNLPL
ncbi:hypothetical protein [Flavobacterium agrisoli]|uniref:Uncharacterized protein n=1 Tax=Flavobacterium agrisoli TaxID=2793066 RepID=A0A934PMN9_9FLAO|nr:hypothetical protein [Flavobacterium agrisoli]MBK0371022.1 hypothetical protein [Flavobacterium agrisoli]